MTKLILLPLLFLAAGCSTKIDQEMMVAREKVRMNQGLYAQAERNFADLFQQYADSYHTMQEKTIIRDELAWQQSHTVDGQVVATATEFDQFMTKIQEAKGKLRASREKATGTVTRFRDLVSRNQAFLDTFYAKEVEAQKAKESAANLVNSTFNFISGLAASAAGFLPFAF